MQFLRLTKPKDFWRDFRLWQFRLRNYPVLFAIDPLIAEAFDGELWGCPNVGGWIAKVGFVEGDRSFALHVIFMRFFVTA